MWLTPFCSRPTVFCGEGKFALLQKDGLLLCMKQDYSFLWLVILFAAFVCPSLQAQKVVIWNLEWYPGKTRDPAPPAAQTAHAEAVKAALKEIDPDILLVQEVGNWEAFADLVSVVPGLKVNVLSLFKDEEGIVARQQVGIASKWGQNSAWFETWKPVPPLPTRGFAFAALEEASSGKLVFVYSVHLKSNRGSTKEEAALNEGMRNESVRQLIAHFEESKKIYGPDRVLGAIIGGDINTNQDGKFGDTVVADLVKAGFWNTWALTPARERWTWRGNLRFEPITFDYIFLAGFGNPKARLLDPSAETSDHRPVEVDLGIQ